MKTHAVVDVFDESEVEVRKYEKDPDLDGIKVLGFNLIDANQLYLFIQEEDGSITSTIVDVDGFFISLNSLIDEINVMRTDEMEMETP